MNLIVARKFLLGLLFALLTLISQVALAEVFTYGVKSKQALPNLSALEKSARRSVREDVLRTQICVSPRFGKRKFVNVDSLEIKKAVGDQWLELRPKPSAKNARKNHNFKIDSFSFSQLLSSIKKLDNHSLVTKNDPKNLPALTLLKDNDLYRLKTELLNLSDISN